MLAAQSAYGPHDTRLWSSADISLGRCLYKLLPEDDHDRQPLVGGGGRYVLVADVRLDNREELLDRLGIPLPDAVSLSDAAVLLACFERWQEATLDFLNGDFALALWDAHARKLLLARDPTGQRPLSYHRAETFFAFSSMPKGLHALSAIPREVDRENLAQFIALIPEMGQRSYYRRIEQLPPGSILEVSTAGVRTRTYWRPQRRDLGLKSFADHIEAFRAELDRSVKVRLRGAQGPLAAHLSSGWDSSSVAATAARLLSSEGGEVIAFTSVPRRGNGTGAPFNRIADEGRIAADTAAMHRNIRHILVEGSGRSPIADLDRYVETFDRPLYNLCNLLWSTEIRRRARGSGANVLLTGELGNYSISAAPFWLLADLIREGRWLSWWREASALARNRSSRYRGIAAMSFGPWVPDAVWKLFRPLSSRPEVAAYTALHPQLEAEVDRLREERAVGLASRPKNHFEKTLEGLGHYDYGHSRKGTLAGWGVDERDPTADRRLIEFCLSLPVDMLLKDGVRRPLARAALADRLPPAVTEEKRKGYQAADWHEGLTRDLPAIRSLIEDIADNPLAASLIDIDALRVWTRDWPSGGWERPAVVARYRGALLGALSAGHFILNVSAADPAASRAA